MTYLTILNELYRIGYMNNIDYITLIISLGIAIALYAMPFTRRHIMAPYGTIVHEYGHAIANIATLGIPTGIKVYPKEGGGVTHHIRARGLFPAFGAIFSGLFGYPAPILAGYLLVVSPISGYGYHVLTTFAVLSFFMIILMRNFFGLLMAVLSFGYLFLCISTYDAYPQLGVIAGAILIVVGVMDFLYLLKLYFTGMSEESDLGILKEAYFFPQWIWLIGMIGLLIGGIQVINHFFLQ